MTLTTSTPPDRGKAWFDDLFRRHAGPIFRFVVRRAARDDADDLTADVFVVAWRRRAEVPDGFELQWLYRTAGFVVANHHRKGRPVPVAELPEEAAPDLTEHIVIEDLDVRRAFATLRPRDQQILLLAAWEGLRGEALATALAISRGGADAALSRARSRLEEAWSGGPTSRDAPPAARPAVVTTQEK